MKKLKKGFCALFALCFLCTLLPCAAAGCAAGAYKGDFAGCGLGADYFTIDGDWRAATVQSCARITSGSVGSAAYNDTLPARFALRVCVGFEAAGEGTVTVCGVPVRLTYDGKTTAWYVDGVKKGGFKAAAVTLVFQRDNGVLTIWCQNKPAKTTCGEETNLLLEADGADVSFNSIALDVFQYKAGDLYPLAQNALNDLLNNYWDSADNRLINTHGGLPVSGNNFVNWEVSTAMQALMTGYELTGDTTLHDRIAAEWTYMKSQRNSTWFTAVGKGVNPALDDAAWSAMLFMLFYQVTGDPHVLTLCHTMLVNSYAHWKDGTVGNGLWYSYPNEINNRNYQKTIYDAGLILAGLEYEQITRGTPLEDAALFADTQALYDWNETTLLRDGQQKFNGATVMFNDDLYYVAVTEQNGTVRPELYQNPIQEAGSSSSLMGNMAMAVIHKMMYNLTGDDTYLQRAVRTANAMLPLYAPDGMLINDFDPWTNCTFFGRFVQDVLPLPGVDKGWGAVLTDTALSGVAFCRTDNGTYKASWTHTNVWAKVSTPGGYDLRENVMMTSVNTIHMIVAAALAEKMGIHK